MNNTQEAMTERKQALQDLRDNVVAGESDYFDEACDWFGTENTNNLIIAYNGSLDAALALHNAVLPGWGITIGTENNGEFHVIVGSVENVKLYSEAFNVIMSRSWLQAILSALIEGEGD